LIEHEAQAIRVRSSLKIIAKDNFFNFHLTIGGFQTGPFLWSNQFLNFPEGIVNTKMASTLLFKQGFIELYNHFDDLLGFMNNPPRPPNGFYSLLPMPLAFD
jgi:hypothetical protein